MVPDEMEDLYMAIAAELKVNHTELITGLLLKVFHTPCARHFPLCVSP